MVEEAPIAVEDPLVKTIRTDQVILLDDLRMGTVAVEEEEEGAMVVVNVEVLDEVAEMDKMTEVVISISSLSIQVYNQFHLSSTLTYFHINPINKMEKTYSELL